MQRIEALFEKAKVFYDNGDPGHDIAHINRVVATCKSLSATEGADVEIVLAAAILHDVVNLPKNHPERLQASQMAAEKSKSMMSDSGFSEMEINRIATVITEHSYSLGKKPSSVESAILQDADKLDAIGAIGIMRAVSCGSRLGSSYYQEGDPFAEGRELNDKAYTIDHFFTKLLKLPDLMNTKSARLEADRRTEFMQTFLDQLKNEIESNGAD
jgi:uncharacterized protein